MQGSAGRTGAAEADVRRFAGVLAGVSIGLSEISPSGRIVAANAELCRIVGRSHEETSNSSILDMIHPDDVDRSMRAVEDVAASGIPKTIGKRYLRPDGSVVPANCSLSRLIEGVGEPRILVASRDLTEDVRTRSALSASTRSFSEFAQALPNVIWIRDAATFSFEFASRAALDVYGLDPGDLGRASDLGTWLDAVVPEDRQTALGSLTTARNGARAVVEFRIRHRADGRVLRIRSTTFPMTDEDGAVRRIGGISTDITVEKREQEAKSDLLLELQHRSRNILSVVRSVVRRSSRTAEDLSDFVSHLEGRIGVLSRTQNLLTRDVDARVDLETLVLDELRVQAAPDDSVSTSGPGIDLGAREAEILSQAVHELATNAVKFGALSRPGGRISVRWTVDPSTVPAVLRIVWRETGAGRPVSIDRRGYGAEMIERRLAYDLGGEGSFRAAPDGVVAEISIPLASRGASDVIRSPRGADG